MKGKRDTLLENEKKADLKLLYFSLSKYKEKKMDSRKTLKRNTEWGKVNIRISTGDATPRKEILRNSE